MICPSCGALLPGNKKNPRTPAQLAAQRGGTDVVFDEQGNRKGGGLLLAVVTIKPGERGRRYRLPTEQDYMAVWKARQRLQEVMMQPLPNSLSPVPDEPLPPIGTLGFRVQRYGMHQWADLFTVRQKLALVTLTKLAAKVPEGSVRFLLATVISRCVDYWSSGVRWVQQGEFVADTFSRQALPIVWDFAEVAPWGDGSGNFDGAIDWVCRVIEAWPKGSSVGYVQLADACDPPLPGEAADLWFTDPPYYDAVPYADLSDFFFIWLKRTLPGHSLLRDPFDSSNPLTPKTREAVQDEVKWVNSRPKDRAFFEETMARAFAEGRRVLRDAGIGCVVFAHKTTEGWEALLSGIIRGGWVVTGSWPIATERPGRLREQNSAALETSVHIICRPRPEEARIGDWGEVFRELPRHVGEWMDRLQLEGVRGADLVFACIGPALEIYSQYSKVVDAEEAGDPSWR